MTITFEIPPDIARRLEADTPGSDLNLAARELLLVELYRERRISHRQLGEALDLERYETDGVLKRHGVGLDASPEDLRAEAGLLSGARVS